MSAEERLHYLGLNGLDVAIGNPKVTLDPKPKKSTAKFGIEGWARPIDETTYVVDVLDDLRWYDLVDTSLPPKAGLEEFRQVKADERKMRFVAPMMSGLGVDALRIEVVLPAGARAESFERRANKRWSFRYTIPAPKAEAGKDARPSFDRKARREILPALRKLHGATNLPSYHLAWTTFRNRIGKTVGDVRCHCRLTTSVRQTESAWEDVAGVAHPDQSVQYPLHAVLESASLMLAAGQEASLSVEYEYTVGGTKQPPLTKKASISLLGKNDAVFSQVTAKELPNGTFYHDFREGPVVLAAVTTPNDGVVKSLKGEIAKAVGGLPTTTDEGAVRYAKAIYDFFRANITYSGPAGGELDGRLKLHINYPRDVSKAASGTCIDPAVTYASIAEAAGLNAGVILIQGHAFPYVVLPRSGEPLLVESTACGKGTFAGSLPFARALELGRSHLARARPMVHALMKHMRTTVSAPELPELKEVDPLKTWGRKMPPTSPTATIGKVSIRHNVQLDGATKGVLGLEFKFDVAIDEGKDHECELLVRIVKPDGTLYLDVNNKPEEYRGVLKPDRNGKYTLGKTLCYPYSCFAANDDGVWREYGLLADVLSKTCNESITASPIFDRLFLGRVKEPANVLFPRSKHVLLRTRQAMRGVQMGTEVEIKDVWIGLHWSPQESTEIRLVDGNSAKQMKSADGRTVSDEGKKIGPMKLWLPNEKMKKVGVDKAKLPSVWLVFWDKGSALSPKLLESITLPLVRNRDW